MLDIGPALVLIPVWLVGDNCQPGLSGHTRLCMNGLRDLAGAQQLTVNFEIETKVRLAVGWQPVSGD
jgi:hypothetical protein